MSLCERGDDDGDGAVRVLFRGVSDKVQYWADHAAIRARKLDQAWRVQSGGPYCGRDIGDATKRGKQHPSTNRKPNDADRVD